jgi:polyphosphate kinase 2
MARDEQNPEPEGRRSALRRRPTESGGGTVAKGKKHDGKKAEKSKGAKESEPATPAGEESAVEPETAVPTALAEVSGQGPAKLGRKQYEAELAGLQGELVALQEWVKSSGAKVCIVFEGRDTAGKGGTIKRITERVSPRVFRVVALQAPTPRERSQMYVQRYLPHFPAAGEVVIFDRSWYNRAGVEPVMGFCTEDETSQFLELAPAVEKQMIHAGIILIKYWLEVSPEEQTRRLRSRINDPRKMWKLSDMDLRSYSRWYDYSRRRDAMLAATDTEWAPWHVVHTDDKKRGRLNLISHLLTQIPYEPLPPHDVKLPRRQRRGNYTEPDRPLRLIPTPF